MSDYGKDGGKALLPGGVDVGVLAALFDNRRHSHGFLLFFALLDALEERDGDRPLYLPIDELVVRALEHAWMPYFAFRLSFGAGDRIGLVLDRLPASLQTADVARDSAELRLRLREAIPDQDLLRLGRYVLRRLVRPFFVVHLRPVLDRTDRSPMMVARERLALGSSVYRLDPARRLLEVEAAWHDYLRNNGPMVRGWASWRWTQHLQKRNPLALGLSRKLFAPPNRTVPDAARAYWRAVVERVPIRCPFSGDPLDPDRATLEPFVPWNFLGDDPLWNLLPASPRVAAVKGDRFPETGFYLDALAETQATGIVSARDALGANALTKTLEPFFAELGIQPELALGDAPKEWVARALRAAYDEALRPLEVLADRQGFEIGWHFNDVA